MGWLKTSRPASKFEIPPTPFIFAPKLDGGNSWVLSPWGSTFQLSSFSLQKPVPQSWLLLYLGQRSLARQRLDVVFSEAMSLSSGPLVCLFSKALLVLFCKLVSFSSKELQIAWLRYLQSWVPSCMSTDAFLWPNPQHAQTVANLCSASCWKCSLIFQGWSLRT